MPFGLPAALLMLAQAAANPAQAYGPAAPPPPKAQPAKPAGRECAPQSGTSRKNEIVVCAVKPQGYRIDPDVLAARRMKKKGDAGQPNNPHETYADHSCATVGPMGCRGGPVIDVAAAAVTAATMIEKAAKGENVGQTLVTDPRPSEYQLYQEAKRQREAKEDQAAAARAKATAEQAGKPAAGTNR